MPRNRPAPVTDYFEILDVPRDATSTQIKTAFRRLSLLNHPDKAGQTSESHEKFIAIREAYEVLSDETLRAVYEARFPDPQEPAGGAANFTTFSRQRSPRGPNQRSARTSRQDNFDYSKLTISRRKNWGPFKNKETAKEEGVRAIGILEELERKFEELFANLKQDIPKAEKAVWNDMKRAGGSIRTTKSRLEHLVTKVEDVPKKRWKNSAYIQILIDAVDGVISKIPTMEKLTDDLSRLSGQVRYFEGSERKLAKQRFRLTVQKWP